MAIDTSPVSFQFKMEGPTTMEEFSGTFKVRPILTQAQQIDRDNLVKELLGGSMKDASGRALSQALLIAETRVRVVDAPGWWKESRGGMDLIDEEILAAVFDKCMETEQKWRQEVKERAEKAKAELAAMPATR